MTQSPSEHVCAVCGHQYSSPPGVQIITDPADPGICQLFFDGKPVHLTRGEAFLFKQMWDNLGKVIHRERLWVLFYEGKPESKQADPKIFDIWVCKLRRKLREANVPIVIDGVWGRGYTIRKQP